MLQTDLSYLLKKSEGEEYPWAVNIYDLEHILGGMKHKGWKSDRLCQYLDARSTMHGRLQTYDELEISGYHLREETLQPLLAYPHAVITLHPSYADIYIDINEELRGGLKADLSPQGSFTGDINQFSTKFLNHEFLLGLPNSVENEIKRQPLRKHRVRRNDPCPCGSGNKYKKCCGA